MFGQSGLGLNLLRKGRLSLLRDRIRGREGLRRLIAAVDNGAEEVRR
jgi:hypothetical protein